MVPVHWCLHALYNIIQVHPHFDQTTSSRSHFLLTALQLHLESSANKYLQARFVFLSKSSGRYQSLGHEKLPFTFAVVINLHFSMTTLKTSQKIHLCHKTETQLQTCS